MTLWALAHPWMAFVLAVLALIVIEETVANVCKAIKHIGGAK